MKLPEFLKGDMPERDQNESLLEAYFQPRSHDPGFHVLRLTSWGMMLVNRNDRAFEFIDRYGELMTEELLLAQKLLAGRPEAQVVDVGANIGCFTIPVAQFVPKGSILAIEPQRLCSQLLAANCALNSLANVDVERVAISNVRRVVHIHDTDPEQAFDSGCYTVDPFNRGGVPTPQVTIDQMGFDRMDFIKIDVEGAEPAVLEGARETISKYRPAIYLEFFFNRAEIMRRLRQFPRYHVWRHLARLIPERNFNRVELLKGHERIYMDMVLALPDEWLPSVPDGTLAGLEPIPEGAEG